MANHKAMNLDNVLELQDKLVLKIAEKSIFKTGYSSIFNVSNQPAIGISSLGKKQYRLAIHVQDKLALLEYEQDFAEAQGEVDIEITGVVYKQHSSWRNLCRPLCIGASISHPLAGAGTLGCFVRKREQTKDLLILSNNHVLANENTANKNDPIIQPAIEDGGDIIENKIAELQEYIALKPNDTNFVDAAIAKIDSNVKCIVDKFGSWQISTLKGINTNEFIQKGYRVSKIGRSGPTWGRLRSMLFKGGPTVNYGSNVNFGTTGNPRFYRFSGVIAIEGEENQPFSQSGDSGSLVFDREGYAIGLIFAKSTSGGSNDCGITYAIPIQRILNELDLDLVSI